MDYIVVVKVVDGFKDLFDCLGCIFLRKFAIFADAIKKLSTSSQLSHDVVFVLGPPSPYQLALLQG